MTDSFMTPPTAASLLNVRVEKVLTWIHKGELRAINISDGKRRPRYRISPEALSAFVQSREIVPRPQVSRRNTDGEKFKGDDYTDFFPESNSHLRT